MAPDGDNPSGSESSGAKKRGEVEIDPCQLRPGVHVRIPLGWLEHPFLYGSFVVTTDEQVRQIAALNLPQIYCDPSRCTSPPLDRPALPPQPSPEELQQREALAAELARQTAAKQQRTAAVSLLRDRLDAAQSHYVAAAKLVGEALSSFDATPKNSLRLVTEVSAQSAAVLVRDPDSAIALIAEKVHADIDFAHALSVMTLALLLGKQARLPEAALREIGVCALLHDIGKASLSRSLLRRTERNKYEETNYRSHCQLGHEMALRAGPIAPQVAGAILHHHEHVDGSGYPGRLAGTLIPLGARIVAVANRFDNLANPVNPRNALSPSEALASMWAKEKGHFDATLLQLFVRAMGVYPPGSLVLLSDGHSGVVVASASVQSPLRPQVLLYEPGLPRRHALIVDLAADQGLKIERSLHARERPEEEVDFLLPRRKLSWLHMSSP
ncbi:Metal dependent phosphohydrolase [Rubrivivax sp. A210]|uniref:HD-GYP domain-containing protein n=1 Tax=Rubrivivax sp. A210 TaxID=2772301 RepID=UPI001917A921|nr:HD-GYP domain-containing protein [Rubrivivax sp. A210]CAD5371999.1 Metal dependent phosphohydrolase [Rubrivivax sp. A210]